MRFFCFVLPSLALAGCLLAAVAQAQTVDCERLQAQIAQAGNGGGNRYAGAARKQAAELARTRAYAHQLGCDGGFSFFGGGDPQCGGLNHRIAQMQANLGQLQAASTGGGQRADLVARYNAYCRGGQPQQAQPRGFFESLFGGGQPERAAPVPEAPVPDGRMLEGDPDGGDGYGAHGGSQVVCVKTCDGGFFPMGLSARRGQDNLAEMCTALCPGTEATVFTRNPDADIKTAVSLDGKPYMDLPNALKFQKNVSQACSCHPAGKTWAEALANAEALNNAHKGDIMVTQAKSDELSRPNLDAKARAALLKKPATAMVTPEDAGKIAAGNTNTVVAQPLPDAPTPSAPADAVKPAVRRVGPQL